MNHSAIQKRVLKSITIHGMEPELAARLERRARESGQSLNKAIKSLLAEALGVFPSRVAARRRQFEPLCGAWSKREAEEFARRAGDFERVDPEDWK